MSKILLLKPSSNGIYILSECLNARVFLVPQDLIHIYFERGAWERGWVLYWITVVKCGPTVYSKYLCYKIKKVQKTVMPIVFFSVYGCTAKCDRLDERRRKLCFIVLSNPGSCFHQASFNSDRSKVLVGEPLKQLKLVAT